jgi:hypothetical protein
MQEFVVISPCNDFFHFCHNKNKFYLFYFILFFETKDSYSKVTRNTKPRTEATAWRVEEQKHKHKNKRDQQKQRGAPPARGKAPPGRATKTTTP